jgi:hypothetical protein
VRVLGAAPPPELVLGAASLRRSTETDTAGATAGGARALPAAGIVAGQLPKPAGFPYLSSWILLSILPGSGEIILLG